MDFKNIDPKKLPIVINAIGVIVMFIWGVLGNDWSHSWIAVAISGVISGVIYSLFGSKEK
ncbi:MAG: hypothetical protein IJQ71_11335 [Clostridia bacterium]|jgi:hypothetical protein|nr:hypothetical protein [Clostridia bacterium]